MLPQAAAALSLSWFQKWVIRRVVLIALKRLNRLGRGYFSRQLAFEIRRGIIEELTRLIAEAKTRTPDFTVDEDALQCAAWVLESDSLQRKVNAATGTNRDVHERWPTRTHP